METIKLTTRIDPTGTLRLEVPTALADQDVEVLLVLQALPAPPPLDAMGYPLDFFARLDAMPSDAVVERGDQGTFETRTPLE